MSGIATAIAGSAVIGAVASNNASKRATRSADNAAANELAFNQERYDDWKEVYGDLQSNLSDYYNNLSPDFYETQGLEAFNKEFELTQTRLQESLSQRGITDSGISAQLEQQGEIGAAEQRAKIRATAPAMAAEEKTRFLQIGLGQNPAGSIANTLANQSNRTATDAANARRAAGQATGAAIAEIGNAAGALANYDWSS